MEILAIIGIIVLGLIIFTGGGILGWLLKGIGAIFELMLEGWGSCLRVVAWIVFDSILIVGIGFANYFIGARIEE